MSVENRIRFWNELHEYSDKLSDTCREVQEGFDVGQEDQALRQMVQSFRQTLAVLHLIRNESELLAALISHDFLDRFAGLSLRLDQLALKPTRERLDRVCSGIWVVRQIIESLVFWIDHQKVKLQRISLGDYSGELSSHMTATFPSVSFSAKTEDLSIPVLIYKPIVTNFMINSIVNAMKHGNAKKVEFVASKKDDKAYMAFRDDGSGIDVPLSEIMYGLGLLMIEKRLAVMDALLEVEGHGGIDGGALFRIVFPIAPEPVEEKVIDLPPPPEELETGKDKQ